MSTEYRPAFLAAVKAFLDSYHPEAERAQIDRVAAMEHGQFCHVCLKEPIGIGVKPGEPVAAVFQKFIADTGGAIVSIHDHPVFVFANEIIITEDPA